MKFRLLLLLSLCTFFLSGYAEKNSLAFTSWKLTQVKCNAVAVDASNQPSVDSALAYLQKTQIANSEVIDCEFTDSELIFHSKGDSGRWKYKLNGNKLLVDFGNGKMYILDVKSITDAELLFALDKKRFFISDYAPKNETLKTQIGSLELLLYFKKSE